MINDFIFCPASIYYHGFYEDIDVKAFQEVRQIKGTFAHSHIDSDSWSKSEVICGLSVFSERFGIFGRIDKYYPDKKLIVESKNVIRNIYDGYIFQLYGQYFGMIECGYEVEQLALYSISDHKKYIVDLPENNCEFLEKFEKTINEIRNFKLDDFKQENCEKCNNCIYSEPCIFCEAL